MKILWISSIAWKDGNKYPYPINGPGAVSGSLFQQSMIEGLEKIGHKVDIVSDYPYAVGCNVNCSVEWSHNKCSNDISIKTIDIPYISIIYKTFSLKKAVKKKISASSYDIAICYLVHHPYMAAIKYAKQLNNCIKTVLICPDLPDMMDMSLSEKIIKKFLKKIDMYRIKNLYKNMDGFVLFSEKMINKIDIKQTNYIVIEGIATTDNLDITSVEKENFIMHAGTLHKNIGVENIIKAMDYVNDPTLQLKIYGTGELAEYIKNISQKNPRIVYGGFVSRDKLFEEEKKAIALVNARNPKHEYTKYSFPSKTFEYLYSGTPFITTKLEGVPKEYSQYLYETKDDKPESVAKMINKILATDKQKLKIQGELARTFVRCNKSKEKQSELLSEFLQNLK